jgi:hypothetical protein
MLIKNPELIIKPEDPFAEDAINRKAEIEKLTNILSFIDEPFVLAITSPWGNGKTKFLEMWRAYLTRSGINSICYNAWENDYVDDPMISLIGEISSQINSIKFSEKAKGREALKKAKEISAVILKRSVPVAVKVISAGIIDDKVISEAISETTTDLIKDKMKEYEKSKKDIKHFKSELQTFVSSLSVEDKVQIPFIIFIDELDRCKPDFAIELLERLKHFFNVTGIVFVIAIDRKQLEQSVKTIFGMNNPDGYIRKFIDLEYFLLEPEKGDFSTYLIRRFKIEDFIISNLRDGKPQLDDLQDISSELFKLFDLKLRQQEQFFSQLAVVLKIFPKSNDYYFTYLCFLLLLSNYYRKQFLAFINGEMSGEELLEFIENFEGKDEFFESYSPCCLEVFLYNFFNDEKLVEQKIQDYQKRANDETEMSRRAEQIVRIYERLRHMDYKGILNTTVNRILLSEQFRW